MSVTISTFEQGHEHASNASEYYAKGLLINAAEEHYKAAEAFQTCVNQSTDEHTKETLRKLCNHHFSVGKDLQRRIAKLKEEGKDPSLPQVNQPNRGTSGGNDNEAESNSGSGLHVPRRGRNLDSSTATFDESFMVLNQQNENSGEDSPFDLFWKVTGEIMYNLSQPMSFQSAAMQALDAVKSRTTSTQSNPEGDGGEQNLKSDVVKSELKKADGVKPPQSADDDDDFDVDDDEYDSLDDFCFIPSSSSSDLSSSARLRRENVELKNKLDAMEKQMSDVKRQIKLRNEQDQHLRDNIMLARKEAQRAMAASTCFVPTSIHSMANLAVGSTGGNSNAPQPAATGGRDRETALLRRIRELEDEVRLVRSENDKQKAMIAKFRERWERLKESAKRKKAAKANSAGHTESSLSAAVRERIDEDPEGEAAAENSGKEAN